MKYVNPTGYQEQRRQSRGLDGLSALQVAEHLVLYAGYVRQVNILNDELAALRAQGRASGRDMQFAELTRRLGYEYNGMILHEYYFSNLRGGADPRPAAGSAIAAALRTPSVPWSAADGTSGPLAGCEAWAGAPLPGPRYRPRDEPLGDPASGRRARRIQAAPRDGCLEHAFMRDYAANEKGRYIDAFFRNVDWATVRATSSRAPGHAHGGGSVTEPEVLDASLTASGPMPSRAAVSVARLTPGQRPRARVPRRGHSGDRRALASSSRGFISSRARLLPHRHRDGDDARPRCREGGACPRRLVPGASSSRILPRATDLRRPGDSIAAPATIISSSPLADRA